MIVKLSVLVSVKTVVFKCQTLSHNVALFIFCLSCASFLCLHQWSGWRCYIFWLSMNLFVHLSVHPKRC